VVPRHFENKRPHFLGKGSCAQKVKKMEIVVFDPRIKKIKRKPKSY
jgi:hypothetical protein